MKTSGNTILITGGGSGIGQALAHRFHDLGNHVVVAGRRRAALEETIADKPGMSAIEIDVEDPQSIADFAARVIAAYPALNVLINNAGIMQSEDLTHESDLADAEAMIVTNILGPMRLTNALIGHLTSQAGATIVNVTSGLASVPLASAPTYSATKAALHSYTQSLRAQLKDKVEVIELAPPGVRTHLTPGQSTREGYLTLDAYADEVMTLFAQTPTPPEILVERVKFLRNAEAEGRYEQAFRQLNG